MTPEEKAEIDAMDHYDMLMIWRNTQAGDLRFQGERGQYFAKVMAQKRAADPDQAVRDSKAIGWERR